MKQHEPHLLAPAHLHTPTTGPREGRFALQCPAKPGSRQVTGIAGIAQLLGDRGEAEAHGCWE